MVESQGQKHARGSSLARELDEWKARARLELEVSQKAEEEAARMKIAVKEAQEDTRKLEGYIQKRESEGKKSGGDAVECR